MKRCIVLFNDNISRSAGTERMTILLANELHTRGFKIILIALRKEAGIFFPLNEGIEVYYLSDIKFKLLEYIVDIFLLRKLLKKIQPDIVISIGNMFFRTLPAAMGLKCKLFSWHHNVKYGVYSKLTFKILNILIANFADKFILLSEANTDFIRQKYNNKKVMSIPNPLTIRDKITPSDLQNKTVLYVGRICREKGTDLLLQAWKIIREKYSDWRLQLVGQVEKNFVLENVKEVIINNAVANVEKFYGSSSIFVIPSRAENLPLVVIEAKSFGLPIVSTNWGMNARDMIQNEVDGFIVENFDVTVLAEKMMWLMKDETLRKRMGAASLKSSEKYALDVIMDKWENIVGF
ncbi:MAG: glycosyltransferase family 4 protein [Fibromonadaceae bacterium]|jgi:glycosyltransferase involved in cell wall biosynthesis|nr:glycosyltransferase family 4 protein [Fibromonadaceae bacterium]